MSTDFYRRTYRFLVRVRNALDALIARVRAKAFPASNGMSRRRTNTATPAAGPAKESL